MFVQTFIIIELSTKMPVQLTSISGIDSSISFHKCARMMPADHAKTTKVRAPPPGCIEQGHGVELLIAVSAGAP